MANYSINQHNATTNGVGSATTITVVFTSSQTVGGMNVVTIGWAASTGSINSVSDNINGVYNVAAPIQFNVSSGSAQAIYYRSNISACSASANTVTVTMGQSTSFPDVRISEFASTNGTSWTVDKTVGAVGSGATPTSGNTAATTHANDLIFGSNTTSGSTTAQGSGFTLIAITSPNSNADEWKEVTITGVQASTFAQGAGDNSAIQVVAFNAAASVLPSVSVNPKIYFP